MKNKNGEFIMTINNRYEFVYLFDVKDGNPNGDPDAGNLPRIDSETQHGLVTDVCLKRKIRNYITIAKGGQKYYEIYIKENSILNDQNERAYNDLGIEIIKKEGKRGGGGKEIGKVRDWMCQNFYDIRTFGAVMSTGVNCGQVRGPVQITFARSIDPIISIEHCITRMAVTSVEKAEKQNDDNRDMGRKHTIPYGIYRAHGFISAHLAQDTKFSEEDLNLLWEALKNMFDHDHSAARGMMSVRGLFVFKHDSQLGNAPAHSLFDCVQIHKKSHVVTPRDFSDYELVVKTEKLPSNVSLDILV